MSGVYDYKAVIDPLCWIGRILAVYRALPENGFCPLDIGLLYLTVSLGDNNGCADYQASIFKFR